MTSPELLRNRVLLGLIVFLGLGLRVFHLSLFPLWRDECFTRFYAEQPLAYLWTTGFRLETNPPGFYTLEHIALLLFGTSAAALRAISVVASTLTIPVLYALGRTVANPKVGLISALIFALCPSEIWYAQEARCYAVLQLLLGLMLLGFAQFLSRPGAATSLALYAVSAIAASYCHVTSQLVIAACNIAFLIAAWGPQAFLGRRDIARWLLVNALVGMALVPQVLETLHQAGTSNISWVPPVGFHSLKMCLSELIGGQAAAVQSAHHYFPWILLLVLGVAVYQLRALDGRRFILLVLVPAFFCGLIVLLSLRQSMILPRAFLWLWIPLSVLIGLSLERGTLLRWLVLAATILVFGLGLKAYYFPHSVLKEDWRNLSLPGSASTQIVLNSRISVGPIAYYHPELLPRIRILHDQAAPLEFMEVFLSERFHIPEIDPEGLRSAISSSQPVHVLTRSDMDLNTYLPANLPRPNARTPAMLGALSVTISTWNPDGGVFSTPLPPSN